MADTAAREEKGARSRRDINFTASSSLVGLPAVSPDLTAATGERTDAAHLHHCTGEVAEELGRVRGVGAHLRVGGASAVQLLVRVQESLVAQQVPVVAAVECGGGRGVERREAVVVAGAGAARLQRRRQRRVDVGVVVDPRAEARAPGLAYGVGTYDEQVLAANAVPGGTEKHVMLLLPERATMSVVVRPLSEKAEMRSVRLKSGLGISLLAELKLAVVESLLPSCTVHEGPPN